MLYKIEYLSFLVVLIFVTNLSFSQENQYNKDTVFYYPSGIVSSAGRLKNGQPNGIWKSYYLDGVLKSNANWKDGKLDQSSSFYNTQGILIKTINYSNNLKNGYTLFYDSLNLVIKKLPYVNDTLDGVGYTFFTNGKIETASNYVKGKLQGVLTRYAAADGRIIGIEKYENDSLIQSNTANKIDLNGKKQGFWEDYKDGILIGEGEYVDGQKNGYYRNYDRFGNLISMDSYLFGKLLPKENENITAVLEIRKKYYPNGKLKETGGYKNNQKLGVFNEYDSLGNYIISKLYKNDTLTGEGTVLNTGIYDSSWVFFYPSGMKKSEGIYKDGSKAGKWIYFYENGKKAQTGIYKNDLPSGLWTWYYQNNQIRSLENYYKGKLNGEVTEYDSLGNELTKGNYQDDLREGDWFYHVGDHKEVGQYEYGKREGLWHYYYENGRTAFVGEFKDGEPDGRHKYYFVNGKINLTGKYKRGKKYKRWKEYTSKGVLVHTFFYKLGNLVSVDSQPMR